MDLERAKSFAAARRRFRTHRKPTNQHTRGMGPDAFSRLQTGFKQPLTRGGFRLTIAAIMSDGLIQMSP